MESPNFNEPLHTGMNFTQHLQMCQDLGEQLDTSMKHGPIQTVRRLTDKAALSIARQRSA